MHKFKWGNVRLLRVNMKIQNKNHINLWENPRRRLWE